MAKRTTSIGPGKLYLLNEDGSVKSYLGEAKLVAMDRKEFFRLKCVCKYVGYTYAEDDHTRCEEICRHPKNRPHGHSWGECAWLNCPFNH